MSVQNDCISIIIINVFIILILLTLCILCNADIANEYASTDNSSKDLIYHIIN